VKLANEKGGPLGVLLTLLMVGCSSGQPKVVATLNRSAFLTGELPANPLQWKVISSKIQQGDSSMSTLFGNDAAVTYARTNLRHDYPNGSALSLVTWTQKEDERWFGAKIPDHVKSVEFVFVKISADGRPAYSYRKYEGTPLKQVSIDEGPVASEGAEALLSQRAAVMP
jgi:hypothetical protein